MFYSLCVLFGSHRHRPQNQAYANAATGTEQSEQNREEFSDHL
jgi:hypothetical protein